MRAFIGALALAVSAPALGLAQDATSFRAGPTFVSYTIGGQTTSQIAVPMVAVMPLTSRLTVDVATAFASTSTKVGGASSTISGLTDTQLRANYALAGDNVVLTFGLNLPTGSASVTGTQLAAAQAIGIDFYTFPVPVYGSGLAGTLGVAYAGTAGSWDWGAGASYRKATEIEPVTGGTSSLRFTPGDEFRFRVGGNTALGSGRLALGVIFSAFGTPKLSDTTTVSTGPRGVLQAVYALPVGGNELFFTAWNLFTGSGRLLSGQAESSNITNLGVAYGLRRGDVTWEPNIEARFISQGSNSGSLVFPGLRMRIPAGQWVIYPGAAASFGSVVGQSVSGVRVTLGAQYIP